MCLSPFKRLKQKQSTVISPLWISIILYIQINKNSMPPMLIQTKVLLLRRLEGKLFHSSDLRWQSRNRCERGDRCSTETCKEFWGTVPRKTRAKNQLGGGPFPATCPRAGGWTDRHRHGHGHGHFLKKPSPSQFPRVTPSPKLPERMAATHQMETENKTPALDDLLL